MLAEPTKRLFNFQEEAVTQLLNGRKIIYATMGMGKNPTSVVWAVRKCHKTGKHKILVISTPSKVKTDDHEKDLEDFTTQEERAGIIMEKTSWHSLHKWVAEHKADLSDWVVIADECHRARGGSSSRMGKSFLKITEKNPDWSGFTGTPGDRWIDMYAFFQACHLVRNKTAFMREFCKVQTFKGFPEIVGYYNEDTLKRWWTQISYAPDTSRIAQELPGEQHKVFTFPKPKGYSKVLKMRQKLCADADGTLSEDYEDFIDNHSKLCHYLRQLSLTKEKLEWLKDFFADLGGTAILFFNYTSTADVVEELARKSLPKGAKVWRIDGAHHEIPTEDTIGKYDIVLTQWQSGAEALNMYFSHIWVSIEPCYSYGMSCYNKDMEILTPAGFVPIKDVEVGETVTAYNMETGEAEDVPVLSKIARPLAEGEEMYEYKSTFAGINVSMTNTHDLIWRPRQTHSPWRKSTLEEMLAYPNCFEVPVSADCKMPDNPTISDLELRLVGWFLADGCKIKRGNRYYVTISQSEKNMPFVEEIQSLLDELNIGYSKSRNKKYAPNGKKYADVINFNMCERTLMDNRRGIAFLLPWLDRTLPNELFRTLSKRQVLLMMDGYYHGNGTTKRVTHYKVKTRNVCVGDREELADKLQHLMILRGIRCNKQTLRGRQKNEFNPNPKTQYHLSYRESEFSTINAQTGKVRQYIDSKTKNGARWEKVAYTGNVYCITNRLGTTIMRRDGKIFIAGNCQARGRIKRIGQKNNMLFLYLITDGIEQDIYKCLKNKSDFASDVWCAEKGIAVKDQQGHQTS